MSVNIHQYVSNSDGSFQNVIAATQLLQLQQFLKTRQSCLMIIQLLLVSLDLCFCENLAVNNNQINATNVGNSLRWLNIRSARFSHLRDLLPINPDEKIKEFAAYFTFIAFIITYYLVPNLTAPYPILHAPTSAPGLAWPSWPPPLSTALLFYNILVFHPFMCINAKLILSTSFKSCSISDPFLAVFFCWYLRHKVSLITSTIPSTVLARNYSFDQHVPRVSCDSIFQAIQAILTYIQFCWLCCSLTYLMAIYSTFQSHFNIWKEWMCRAKPHIKTTAFWKELGN